MERHVVFGSLNIPLKHSYNGNKHSAFDQADQSLNNMEIESMQVCIKKNDGSQLTIDCEGWDVEWWYKDILAVQ